MARKRKKLQDLEYNSQSYWEKLLTLDGLSMERGRSDRLSYVGNGAELESIEGELGTLERIKPTPTDPQ